MTASQAAAAAVVRVAAGALSGLCVTAGAVRAFRGIPYAQPPLGGLRWRPPQPARPWDGVRPAHGFGPRCPQPSRSAQSIGYFGPEVEDEGCLTLNVWTAAADRDERRPVMVWLHPGAFYLGSGNLPPYDGTALAGRGAVVVTVNFRLGKLGFLAHPALSREAPSGTSGNYGLLDQVLALEWVAQNIAAFGGDPEQVTIFGQSAGAVSVSCLMAMKQTRGLFHRAIGMSSGAFGPVTTTTGLGESMQSLDAAERAGVALTAALGARSLEEMRALPALAVQTQRLTEDRGRFDPAAASGGAFDGGWPVLDGAVLPESVAAVFAAGRQQAVPLITGSTGNEGATMPGAPGLAAYRRQAEGYGAQAARLLELYPADTDEAARRASATIAGHRSFDWQNWRWARLHAAAGHPTFYYRFTRSQPIPEQVRYLEGPAASFGAFHGADIPYVFGTLDCRPWAWTEADRHLSELMAGYWLAFAATGDPNGGTRPAWDRFDGQAPEVFQLDLRPQSRPVPNRSLLDFWDGELGGDGSRKAAL